MKRIIIIMFFCMFMFYNLSFATVFSDVADNSWFKNYVYDLTNKNVINGYPDGTFRPDNKVTAGEFLKLIIMASAPDVNYELVSSSFDHWAAKYVRVGENYGILESGKYNLDNIDSEISRIEIVKILSRCDMLIKETPQSSVFKQFTDTNSLSDDELIYLSHAVGIGVINGDPEGTFRPNESLSRGECAKVIYTYVNR